MQPSCDDSSSWDNLPEHLIEKVLAYLPTPCLIYAGSVCKKWNSVVSSAHFKKMCMQRPPQRPWLVAMVKARFVRAGKCLAYSPADNRWYKIPCAETCVHSVLVAGGKGLLCFQERDHRQRSLIFQVADPITKRVKRLPPMAFDTFSSFNSTVHPWNLSVAFEVVEISCAATFKVLVFTAEEDAPGLSIRIFDSKLNSWRISETLCAVPALGMLSHALCGSHVYFLLFTFPWGITIAAYDIEHDVWTEMKTPMLERLTNCRLVDCQGQLMAVGFRGEALRNNGVQVWQMNGSTKEWEQLETNAPPELSVHILCAWRESLDQCAGGSRGEIFFMKGDAANPQPILHDCSSRSWNTLPRCRELQDVKLLQMVSYVPRWGAVHAVQQPAF